MYWRHFNLTAEPFSLTPDPSFLYLSPVHAEAFAAMTMGLRERRGLITMIGEVGTGKTTLVYSLLSGLGPEIHTAYISNARLSFDGILRTALRDFGVPCESTHNTDLLEAFNKFLLDCATQGTTAALVIDEAQNLSQETFEDLRLLSNFETYTHKLLQIVLVGQPELDTKLRDPALRQVAERVAVRCIVNPLTRSQARQYLEHRLAAVNGSLSLLTSSALRHLIARSRGIPRSLNILAHNSMLFAYGEESSRVVRRYVVAAVHEKDGRELIRLWRRPKGRSATPVVLKPKRDSRSLWTLGGAAFAGLALGVILAGPSWMSGSSDAPRRAASKAERQARRVDSAAEKASAERAAAAANVMAATPPVEPTPLPSAPTDPSAAVATGNVVPGTPSPADVATPGVVTPESAAQTQPTPLAAPAPAAGIELPSPDPSTAPRPSASLPPEAPRVETPPSAAAEVVNEFRTITTPIVEPHAVVVPMAAPAEVAAADPAAAIAAASSATPPPAAETPTPLLESASAPKAEPTATAAAATAATSPTSVVPAAPPTPVVAAAPAIAPAPSASTTAVPPATPAAPVAVNASATSAATASAAPATASKPPAEQSATTRQATAATRAAVQKREAQAAARARAAAAARPTRAPAARTAAPAPVAVIPPVAPAPAIAPAIVPPVAAPGPTATSSVQFAARAVAPPAEQPVSGEATPARPDPGTVVTVPQGSSLSDLMLAVYGQYNSQMMERVQAVNPQVTDPDRIVAGDRLRFPEKTTTPAAPGTEAR